MKDPVGLIGIGLVGTALAENLLKAGYPVIGYDIDPEKCSNLQSMGGRSAASASEVGEGTERVFLSLMNTGIVKEVLLGRNGLLSSTNTPHHIIDTTTGDPDETEKITVELEEKGIFFLDAPISGSSQQIRERQGVVMIGGELDAYHRCEDLFQAVATEFFHIGPPGSGSRAKLVSNVILGLNRLVLAEGLVFAERFGFELGSFLEMLKKTPAYSCSMDVKGKKMIEEDFRPQSRITQHLKDLEISLQYAQKLGQPLPLTRVHKHILEQAIDAGDGDLDNAAVLKQLRRLAIREQDA